MMPTPTVGRPLLPNSCPLSCPRAREPSPAPLLSLRQASRGDIGALPEHFKDIARIELVAAGTLAPRDCARRWSSHPHSRPRKPLPRGKGLGSRRFRASSFAWTGNIHGSPEECHPAEAFGGAFQRFVRIGARGAPTSLLSTESAHALRGRKALE